MDMEHYLGPMGRMDLDRVATREGIGGCWRRPGERYKIAKARVKDLERELHNCRQTVTQLARKAAETMD